MFQEEFGMIKSENLVKKARSSFLKWFWNGYERGPKTHHLISQYYQPKAPPSTCVGTLMSIQKLGYTWMKIISFTIQ